MRSFLSRITFFGFLLIAAGPLVLSATVSACPDIDGLTDVNCDQILQILCFGDSITKGEQDSAHLGYPGRLAQIFPHARVINLGLSGETTVDGVSRASRLFPRYSGSDYVIVLEGVNDFFLSSPSTNRVRINDLSIIQKGRNIGANALLANLTDVRRSTQKSWVRSVNSQLNPYKQIDFFSLGTSIISSDLLHPNGSGYQKMAQLAASILLSVSMVNKPPDTDGDGIYDFAESRFGTSPSDSDSDNDGLLDGAEVFQYHSNPLATDTDGDGYSDGDEVQVIGSDPADPRPGAPVLDSLQVVN